MRALHTHWRHAIAGRKNCAGTFQRRDCYRCRKRQGRGRAEAGSDPGRTIRWLSSDGRLGTERIRCRAGQSFRGGRLHSHSHNEFLACVRRERSATFGRAWDAVLWMMPPEEHDECVARVSHLPHAVAAALVNAISLRVPDAGALAGGGYRDTTRIAAAPARYVAGNSSRELAPNWLRDWRIFRPCLTR